MPGYAMTKQSFSVHALQYEAMILQMTLDSNGEIPPVDRARMNTIMAIFDDLTYGKFWPADYVHLDPDIFQESRNLNYRYIPR